MNINKLAAALTLGLAVCSSAFAQGRPSGPPAGAGGGVAHLTEVYAQVVPFGSNNDGVLDRVERAVLITAMASGGVKAPFRTGPPEGVNPSAEQNFGGPVGDAVFSVGDSRGAASLGHAVDRRE